MLKISAIVEEIVSGSEIIYSALSEGLLNLSAYAENIRSEVEARTKKPVKKGSIVAALARMEKKRVNSTITQNVKIDNLTIKSPIAEVVYDRTAESLSNLQKFYATTKVESHEYFTVTQGNNEISIICSEKLKDIILKLFEMKPKVTVEKLVAVSIRFSEDYINQPNVIFSLLRRIAIKNVVIAELVSTYTELTFIVRQGDLDKVMGAFSPS